MNTESSVQTAFCSSYERLLGECHSALKDMNERRNEIFHAGLRGRKFDDELLQLQAKYAKALNQLQKHTHDCPLCKLASSVFETHSAHDSNFSSDKEVHVR